MPKDQVSRKLRQKWGKSLIQVGWTAIPNIFIDRQDAIGLDPIDMNILLHVAKYWWEAENLPWAAKTRIARAMRVSPRTVQRRVSALQRAKLLKRVVRKRKGGGQGANAFDLSQLIEKAEPFAREVLLERLERRKLEEARRRRKRPLMETLEDEA